VKPLIALALLLPLLCPAQEVRLKHTPDSILGHKQYILGANEGEQYFTSKTPGTVAFCTTAPVIVVGVATSCMMINIAPKGFKKINVTGMTLDEAAYRVGWAQGYMDKRNQKILYGFLVGAAVNVALALILSLGLDQAQ